MFMNTKNLIKNLENLEFNDITKKESETYIILR